MRVGGRSLALPVAFVVETMRPLPIAIASDRSGLVVGTSRIRGEPCRVIDTARLLGVPRTGEPRRFVVVRGGHGERLALAVDDVIGVCAIEGGAPIEASLAADAAVRAAVRAARWIAEPGEMTNQLEQEA